MTLFPALLLASVIDTWKRAEYFATRITVELSMNPRIRYEEVYRWGDSKFVKVFVPMEMYWYRSVDGTWSGRDTLKRLPVNILDLEDIALREVEKATPVVEENEWGYKLEFSTEKGDFEVWLNKNGIPMRIVREFHGIEMKMIYENWDSPPPPKEFVLKDHRFSNELAFPEEVGRVLACLDWFYISKEDGVMIVKGISHGKWVEIRISGKKLKGSVKLGVFYLKTDDEDILKIVTGER